MKVAQAIYGEVRGGHALITATVDTPVAAELAMCFDLPDTAPAGVAWSAYLSGFPHDDYYVLARTHPDKGASRAGMVLTHALFSPLTETIGATDLRPLIAHLLPRPKKAAALEFLNVATSETVPEATPDLAAAARALLGDNGIAVRPVDNGSDGFDDLVVALWARLWPEIRRNFAFRLSFGPDDLVGPIKPTLVCTPTSAIARWRGNGVIMPERDDSSLSPAAALLCGAGEGNALAAFAREIGATMSSFSHLKKLESVFTLISRKDHCVRDSISALRPIGELSPDPNRGAVRKAALVAELATQLPDATATDILPLRNFDLRTAVPIDKVWASVAHWARENRFAADDDTDMLSILKNAVALDVSLPWRKAIVEGLSAAAREARPAFCHAFWRWVIARPQDICAAFDLLVLDGDLESRLTEVAPPNIANDDAETLMRWALQRQWLRFHGAVAAGAWPPIESVRRQIAVDRTEAHAAGIRLALRRATPEQVVACALDIGEPRLVNIAGEAAAKTRELLRDVNMIGSVAQAVWAHALSINSEAWQGPDRPHDSFAKVLTNLLEGAHVNDELIAALSDSPLADLCDFSRRSEVWSRVSLIVRGNLLRATTAGWLKQASDRSIPFSPDDDLQHAMLAGDVLDMTLIELIEGNVIGAIRIVEALNDFDEPRFLRWLHVLLQRRSVLSQMDAEAVGRLVNNRRWRQAADELGRMCRSGRADLKPALGVCNSLLDLWMSWLIGLCSPSGHEKWTLFEEAVMELYPTGPDQDGIWERAGGRSAVLSSYGSGRLRWQLALQLIRNGGGVRATDLLAQMSRDYPSNERIRALSSDRRLFGR